jgi:uncharacterized protein (TIGR02246 family)
MKAAFAGAILVTLTALGCAPPAPSTSEGSEADRQAITELREREIALFSAGNADSVLSVLTDDVVMMPPNEPAMVGKAAVRAWVESMYKQFRVQGTYTSASDLTVVGDWAFERMTFTLTMTPAAGGAAMQDVGKGFHVYRRQPDGSWKIHQDIWNSDNPPPGGQ